MWCALKMKACLNNSYVMTWHNIQTKLFTQNKIPLYNKSFVLKKKFILRLISNLKIVHICGDIPNLNKCSDRSQVRDGDQTNGQLFLKKDLL